MSTYKHMSGAQKRKAKELKDERSKKGQKTLKDCSFFSSKNDVTEIGEISPQELAAVELLANAKDEISPVREITDKISLHEIRPTEEANKLPVIKIEESFLVYEPEKYDVETVDRKMEEKNELVATIQNQTFDIGTISSKIVTSEQRIIAVRLGHEGHPEKFPNDSTGARFPVNVLKMSLANGEKVYRDWLVWSRTKNAFFCFPCRLFNNSGQSVFYKPEGYGIDKTWSKLYDRIPEHENSLNHKNFYVQWKTLDTSQKNDTSIEFLVLENLKNEKKRWRQLLKRLFDIVLFLGERGLAFRGHSSKLGDPHNGNFLGLVELLSHYDPVLAEHVAKVKKSQVNNQRLQVHYLSWEIQNDFIQSCADLVIDAILEERSKSKYYSILVDATPDSAHIEQTTFILRFVWFNEELQQYEIHERFLKFVDCFKKTGKDIAELIKSTLAKYKIPLEDCRGQGYDNGANMKGIYKGVQSRILKENNLALYSPCACHTLNLCGVDAAECCVQAVTFFGNVQKLYNIFSSSPQRWDILKDKIGSSLHSTSATRWSARVKAVEPFAAHIPGLVEALEKVQEMNLTAETKADINGLKSYLKSFESILMASIWFKVLSAIENINLVLQARNATLDVEVNNLNSLITDLSELRNRWDSILNECKAVAENLGISTNFPSKRKRKRNSKYSNKSDIGSDINDRKTSEMIFRDSVFYVILDNVIGNMTWRFEKIKEIENSFSFLWNYLNLTDEEIAEKVKVFVNNYKSDISNDLQSELKHIKAIHKANLGAKALEPFKLLNKIRELNLHTLFPNICIGLRMFLTLPVTVAEAERSFSALKRIKNVLRSTMCQDRLTNLAILAVEPELARKTDYKKLIDHFADKKARKGYL